MSELGFHDGAVDMKGGQVKKFKTQWVVVKSGLLQYFDTDSFPEGLTPTETLRLAGCTLRRCDRKEHKRDNVIALKYTKGKKPAEIFFDAGVEVDLWYQAIADSIALASPRLFGVALPLAVQKSAPEEVPTAVLQIIEALGPHLEIEGIFRLSGSASAVNAVTAAMDAGGAVDPRTDPIVLAAVFKQYLRMLPVPLLTWELYPQWLEVGKAGAAGGGVAKAKELVEKLPPAHQSTLLVVLRFMAEVAEFSSVNMMTSSNLATCLGPTILRGRSEEDVAAAADADLVTKTADVLISQWKAVFGLAKAPQAAAPEAEPAAAAEASAAAAGGPPPVDRSRKPTHAGSEDASEGSGIGGAPASRWIEKDDGYGNVYWYDPDTRTKRYDCPPELEGAAGGSSAGSGNAANSALSPRGRPAMGGIDPTAALKGLRSAPAPAARRQGAGPGGMRGPGRVPGGAGAGPGGPGAGGGPGAAGLPAKLDALTSAIDNLEAKQDNTIAQMKALIARLEA